MYIIHIPIHHIHVTLYKCNITPFANWHKECANSLRWMRAERYDYDHCENTIGGDLRASQHYHIFITDIIVVQIYDSHDLGYQFFFISYK